MAGFGAAAAAPQRCPCGGGPYRQCCGPLHRGEQQASTVEQLMRSRYSAYALDQFDYLLATHPSEQDPAERRRELAAAARTVRWQGLTITACSGGGPEDLEGTVSFEARYRAGGRSGVMRECSRFGRAGNSLSGGWLYLEALELSG